MNLPDDDNQIWPPAPIRLALPPQHDVVLANLIQNRTAAGLPVTKFHLVKGLNKRAGLELRECLSVAQDFTDRACPQIARNSKRRGWVGLAGIVGYCVVVIVLLNLPSYLHGKFRHAPRAKLILWHNNLEAALPPVLIITGVLIIMCIYIFSRSYSRLQRFKW